MCGIAGIVGQQASSVSVPSLAAMAALQSHRGPDDQGIWHHDNVGLAFRRLAIIDLSPAGHQPMCNENGDVWLVFNGEIYNYATLRAELRARGHGFRSRTDTEVVIHAYEEYGDDCVQHFNGMFAFAIWDARRQRLLLARDRIGIKPLYYYHAQERLVFASEIKAVLLGAGLHPCPNDDVVFGFLSHSRLDNSAATFFKNVSQLPASHIGVYEHGTFAMRRYWDIPCGNEDTSTVVTPAQFDTYAERFAHLLTDSIRLQLRSDVPIGTCLSGGLDSSAIVCIANQLLAAEVKGDNAAALVSAQKTFSARYHDFVQDEGRFMTEVVHATGADAHAVFPDGARLAEEFSSLLWFQEEPFLGTSVYAQWNVMRLARAAGVTVLLDGQGSDEQLAGYYRYFGALFADLVRSRMLVRLLREASIYLARGYPLRPALLGTAVALVTASWGARRIWSRAGSLMAPMWLGPDFRKAHTFHPIHTPRCHTSFDEMLHAAMTRESLPALLHYEDRNSMAFSIEARVPFLDHRLVEFVFSLPASAKINAGTTKVIMRRALRGVVPPLVLLRHDKIGFATPQESWLRGPARTLIADTLASPSLAQRGYVDLKRVNKLVQRFQAGDMCSSDALWRCLTLELWLRHMVDTPNWFKQHPWSNHDAGGVVLTPQ